MRPFLTGAGVFALAAAIRLPFAAWTPDYIVWPPGVVDDRIIDVDFRTVSVPDEPWVWLVGGSTVHFAFDRTALPVASRKQTHERGYPSDVALSVAWGLRRTIPVDQRPTRVVWGVTMASWVDRRAEGLHPCDTRVTRERPDPDVLSADRCTDLSDVVPVPSQVGFWWGRVDPWLARRAATRDAVVSWLRIAFGRDLPEPAPDHWHGYFGHHDDNTRRNLEAWERFGVFGPEALSPPLVAAALDVARVCREAGVPLTVVVMPEPSEVRERYDPAARAQFEALLREVSSDVLDIWSAVPDDHFYDQVHVNERGRPVVSEALAQHLQARGAVGAP